MEVILVVGEHLWSTLEQVTGPPNAHIGPCNELVTHSGEDPDWDGQAKMHYNNNYKIK